MTARDVATPDHIAPLHGLRGAEVSDSRRIVTPEMGRDHACRLTHELARGMGQDCSVELRAE